MGFWDDLGHAANDAANGDLGDAANDLGDAANDAANDAGNAANDAANDAGNAANDAVNAAGKAVDTAVHAVDQLVGQAGDAARQLVNDAGNTVDHVMHDAGKAAGDISDAIGDAAKHPLETAADAVGAVDQFIADHSGEIVGGLEVAGSIALYASGVGAPIAAAISGAMATAGDLANGKDAGDALLDGVTTAADKLLPGAGSATRAVVEGLEHGDSAGEIARDAGLNGVGANGGPALGFIATAADDISHGRDAGHTALDLVTQYANDASGDNPLGQIAIAGVNDAVNGDSIEQFGLDVARIYAHQAAGGDASPTAQLSDTFFNDIKDGKSLGETADDLYHQAVNMAERVDHDAPDGLGGAIGGSDVPGGHYAATVAGDLVDGKSPDQIAIDLGKEAAGDVAKESGLGDAVKDAGIDTSDLDPLKPYAETVVNDVTNGKSLEQTAADVGKEIAGDLVKESGVTHDLNDAGIDTSAFDPLKPYAETVANDVTEGKSIGDTAIDLVKQSGGDVEHVAGIDSDTANTVLNMLGVQSDGSGSSDHPPGWPYDLVSEVSSATTSNDVTPAAGVDPDTANMVLNMLGAQSDGSSSSAGLLGSTSSVVSETHDGFVPSQYVQTSILQPGITEGPVPNPDPIGSSSLAGHLDVTHAPSATPSFVSTEPTPISLESLYHTSFTTHMFHG
jgi:hypothetical protein